jgi:P-type Cu2+ transporter
MAQPGALELAGPATPAVPTIGVSVGPGGGNQTITLAVENMTCGGCMRKVEKALLEVPGVASARANLSARRATVVFEEAQGTAAPLVDALGRFGFKAAELAPEALDSGQDTGRQLLSRLAVAGFAAANIMLLSVSVWSGSDTGDPVHALFHWLSAVIALPAIAYAGQPFSVQPGKR